MLAMYMSKSIAHDCEEVHCSVSSELHKHYPVKFAGGSIWSFNVGLGVYLCLTEKPCFRHVQSPNLSYLENIQTVPTNCILLTITVHGLKNSQVLSTMPPKIQADDSLSFLLRCLEASDYKTVRITLPDLACQVYPLTDPSTSRSTFMPLVLLLA